MTDTSVLDGSVASVEAHVAEHPEDAKALLEAEKAKGEDARKTLVASLEKVVEGQHPAPEPVSSSVTVEPAAAPGLLDQFEVTPERGYRRKG